MTQEDLISILPSIILGLAGVIVTIIFAISNTRRENDKLSKELFTEFNKRYGELNEYLEEAIKADDIANLSSKTKDKVIDYFNLCAEEFYWRKKRRIDKLVWDSWSVGMNYWYNHKSGVIKELWEQETNDRGGLKSYYIKNGDEFFKKNNG